MKSHVEPDGPDDTEKGERNFPKLWLQEGQIDKKLWKKLQWNEDRNY